VIAVNPRRDRRGFTLLELLLAIVILGLITATVYGSLARTESSKRIAENRAELYSAGRLAVLKMAGDIEGALSPPSGDRIYFRGTHGRGEPPEIHLVTMNRGGFGTNRVRPGRVLVVYSLTPLPRRRGEYALLREEYLYKAMLDRADGIETQSSFGLEGEEEDAAPTEQASFLLECPDVPDDLDLPGSCLPVTGLTFRFYDETVGDWRDEWDSTVDNSATFGRLPSAVEITLALADEDGAEHPFYTVVDLPLARGQPTPVPGSATTAGGSGGSAGSGGGFGSDVSEDEE
jgi:prepilin-type N-terminal cleavage/methylation domain-containing protein